MKLDLSRNLCLLLASSLLGSTSLSSALSNRDNSAYRKQQLNRRQAIGRGLIAPFLATPAALFTNPNKDQNAAHAYEPDPDPLKESLYLLCRVQEATALQERYLQKATPPIQKMKLTLRLVDKNYRILDQVTYITKFVPPESIVAATQAGNEAAESLQDAIDFVMSFKHDGSAVTSSQKEFLNAALMETREKLFDFLGYLPQQDKLEAARKRVEEENKLNQDEFDPDLATDAGVYNPVVLPWKERISKA